ncbi:MAG TPA: ABC transporter permease [Candidatus Limnocylindria bacterium]|nr:ABC transporter permease [Candidatus Limnocylindria bacterium]
MSPVRALLRRELRQLGRSRGALLSSIGFPALMLVVIPIPQLLGIRATAQRMPEGVPLPPGLASSRPEDLFVLLLYPLFVTIAGLMVPSIAATYAVVSERERRTLELLIALPVRLADILRAKLLALLLLGATTTFPLLAITTTAMLIVGLATPFQVALLFGVLAAALTAATCLAFVLTLLARDFRTANNLNGVLVLPMLVMTFAVLSLVPGDARLVVHAVVLLALGGAALLAGLRWISFERYLE